MRILRQRTRTASPDGGASNIHKGGKTKPCGHRAHVGTCAACQRVQLARWRAQLDEAS
jgi:hypothetical protein